MTVAPVVPAVPEVVTPLVQELPEPSLNAKGCPETLESETSKMYVFPLNISIAGLASEPRTKTLFATVTTYVFSRLSAKEVMSVEIAARVFKSATPSLVPSRATFDATPDTFARWVVFIPATVVTLACIPATAVTSLSIPATVVTSEDIPATVPISVSSLATVVTSPEILATVVTFASMPATVVTFA